MNTLRIGDLSNQRMAFAPQPAGQEDCACDFDRAFGADTADADNIHQQTERPSPNKAAHARSDTDQVATWSPESDAAFVPSAGLPLAVPDGVMKVPALPDPGSSDPAADTPIIPNPASRPEATMPGAPLQPGQAAILPGAQVSTPPSSDASSLTPDPSNNPTDDIHGASQQTRNLTGGMAADQSATLPNPDLDAAHSALSPRPATDPHPNRQGLDQGKSDAKRSGLANVLRQDGSQAAGFKNAGLTQTQTQSVDAPGEKSDAPNNSSGPASKLPMTDSPDTAIATATAPDLAAQKDATDTASISALPLGTADQSHSKSPVMMSERHVGGPQYQPLPHAITSQLAESLTRFSDRPVEITLSPEELGKVRMTLLTDANSLTLNLVADRPETLDLLRRNIDQLAQDFRDLGFANLSFSFEQQHSSDNQDLPPEPPKDGGPAQPDPAALPPTHALTSNHMIAGQIDIRL
jgi:flagellar hook-length control protein FliK